MVKTSWPIATSGEKNLFGFYTHLTVHHPGKSGQEHQAEPWRLEWSGSMKGCCFLGSSSWLAHPASLYHPGPPGVVPQAVGWGLPRQSSHNKAHHRLAHRSFWTEVPSDFSVCQVDIKLVSTSSKLISHGCVVSANTEGPSTSAISTNSYSFCLPFQCCFVLSCLHTCYNLNLGFGFLSFLFFFPYSVSKAGLPFTL